MVLSGYVLDAVKLFQSNPFTYHTMYVLSCTALQLLTWKTSIHDDSRRCNWHKVICEHRINIKWSFTILYTYLYFRGGQGIWYSICSTDFSWYGIMIANKPWTSMFGEMNINGVSHPNHIKQNKLMTIHIWSCCYKAGCRFYKKKKKKTVHNMYVFRTCNLVAPPTGPLSLQ